MASARQVLRVLCSLVLSDWLERSDGRGTYPHHVSRPFSFLGVSERFPCILSANWHSNTHRCKKTHGNVSYIPLHLSDKVSI